MRCCHEDVTKDNNKRASITTRCVILQSTSNYREYVRCDYGLRLGSCSKDEFGISRKCEKLFKGLGGLQRCDVRRLLLVFRMVNLRANLRNYHHFEQKSPRVADKFKSSWLRRHRVRMFAKFTTFVL